MRIVGGEQELRCAEKLHRFRQLALFGFDGEIKIVLEIMVGRFLVLRLVIRFRHNALAAGQLAVIEAGCRVFRLVIDHRIVEPCVEVRDQRLDESHAGLGEHELELREIIE